MSILHSDSQIAFIALIFKIIHLIVIILIVSEVADTARASILNKLSRRKILLLIC